jgi:hypothetical protein
MSLNDVTASRRGGQLFCDLGSKSLAMGEGGQYLLLSQYQLCSNLVGDISTRQATNDKQLLHIPGVAGVRLSESYVQQLLLDHTPSSPGEISCRNPSDIRCYLIDFSGYILASNQQKSEIAAGDFLGRVDDQVKYFLEFDICKKNHSKKSLALTYAKT